MKKLKLGAAILAVLAISTFISATILFPYLPQLLLGEVRSFFVKPPAPETQLTRLEAYNFVPGSRLEDRITVIPPMLLKFAREWDKAPEYEAYAPTAADKALLLEYLALLPEVYRQVFEQRCAGIYFVRNFKGNGVTSWVTDKENRVYFNMMLNQNTLTRALSATLTDRERSCFIGYGADISVDAGTKYKGLLYAFFHEATHAVDYVKGVTPWADDTMPKLLRPLEPLGGDFFKISWESYSLPRKPFDSPLRSKITFYGLGGGPKLSAAEAVPLYTWLKDSTFASLYGSLSWAEDFAELATMGLLTARLGQPYKINYTGPDGPASFEPMNSATVSVRAGRALELLGYRPADQLEKDGADLDRRMLENRKRIAELQKKLKAGK